MTTIKRILKWLFGIAFVLAGANHFLNADFYLKIMPPILPAHLFLVYLSGVFEIVLGVLLLIPKFTRFAAFGLIALLIAVFPANIYMAMNANLFDEFSPAALYLRLPLQFVLIVIVFWFTRVSEKT
ncbi:MAG: DoxX family membrane protein [Acidobacteriota bacterium]|nr:DoxX family membrane protein [Acidobacteriota bacterium]